MGVFLTSRAKTEQTDKPKIWETQNNELYMDDDGQIYLVPREFLTDGYTIPLWISVLGGGNMQWDIRPAVIHDFECKFHQELVVNLSLSQLRQKGFLYTESNTENIICGDIPVEFLELRKTDFNSVNSKFKRMMKSVQTIKAWRVNMMRFCVNFNPGWIATRKNSFDLSLIYKENENEGNTNKTNKPNANV